MTARAYKENKVNEGGCSYYNLLPLPQREGGRRQFIFLLLEMR